MHQNNIDSWQHDHRFGQDQKRSGESRTLIVVAITLAMMVLEISAGVLYGSLALLADGLHMASHATALGIAVFAYAYARRHAASDRFSFGTGKVNALGGFTGAVLLVGFALFMGIESIDRFIHPVDIVFNNAILVAVLGLIVNGVSAWILGADDHHHGHGHHQDHGHHGHDHEHGHEHTHTDHNRRSAYFHVLADALTSVLAIAALLAGKYLGWNWMDPAMGIVGTVLVARWSWGLLRDSAQMLLDRQDKALADEIRATIETGTDERLSDVHVWSIGPGIHAAIAAVVTHEPKPASSYRRRLQSHLPSLVHTTIEVHECSDENPRARRAA